jgi:hypothetical protein
VDDNEYLVVKLNRPLALYDTHGLCSTGEDVVSGLSITFCLLIDEILHIGKGRNNVDPKLNGEGSNKVEWQRI